MRRIRRLVTAAVLVGSLVVPVSAALADGGAQKVPLQHDVEGSCFSGAPPGPGVNGFATIHENGSGTLIAEVALKNAHPNTTYDVVLTQTPSGFGCGTPVGTLTTNTRGNGNANIHEAAQPGTTDAFVLVIREAPFDFYQTQDVPVS